MDHVTKVCLYCPKFAITKQKNCLKFEKYLTIQTYLSAFNIISQKFFQDEYFYYVQFFSLEVLKLFDTFTIKAISFTQDFFPQFLISQQNSNTQT